MNEKESKILLNANLTEKLIGDNLKCYKQMIREVVVEFEEKETQIDNIIITPKGIFMIENKNYSGIIILNKDLCVHILGDKQINIDDQLEKNDYKVNILSKLLNIDIRNIKPYIVMGYNTKINNRSDRRNIVNMKELIDNINIDLNNSKDIYTNKQIDEIYSKISTINKKK